MTTPPTSEGSRRILIEVQALRALAVALVVIYHVWPQRLPGGFIGVDVFFVISGFLITAHLMREHDATGRISLAGFWARRIRRLLPAAFTVLAASVILVYTVLPEVVRAETLKQVLAASGYVLNWVLGFDAVDYLAADNAPTIVQHYWTLSVEEQFYIAWPIMLVVAGFVAARVLRKRPSAAAVAGWSALVVVALSLAYSIYLTWFNPPFAFFATTTRAWEFAAGGLAAAAFARWPGAIDRLREVPALRATSLLTVAGVLVIVVSALLLGEESPFPGALAALPVVGALLVIVGGEPRGWGIGWLTGVRPTQFLGDISYSVYLWHWPLLLSLVIVAGRRPTLWEGLAIIAATVVLAALTKYLIEDRGRRSRVLSRPLFAFAFAAAGIAVFAGVWVGGSVIPAQRAAAEYAQQEAQVTDTAGCFGANAMLGSGDCPDRFVLTSEVDLARASNDLGYRDWCLTELDEDWRSCEFGAPAGGETWALVGDSHAASMVAAFNEYFAQHGVTIVTYLRNGCSGLNVGFPGEGATTQEDETELACREWSQRVRDEIAGRDDISTVVYLNRATIYVQESRSEKYHLTPEEVEQTWQEALDSGKRVISIKNFPKSTGENVPECLSARVGETAPCSVPRDVALPPEPQDVARAAMSGEISVIDLTDAFCDDSTCYALIGDVVVYADTNHISQTYSRTLMPYLGPDLLEAAGLP
ncbi:peptidoglycan/LPS O-acetylase OafA/YrhL [Leifsonia sp. AK011]|uniref:acyltransferase family protein n=1 Tax=Leifsonia sp. AK011 TaxID=2723075 RepID=UPI0015CB21E0|nr:acyltransferase family protein [Leifsonia sp. AK011]NYF08959.1 peptidoglycan/LPS O-acetylase OafA/YrhL [Leifsonia sp. AK011]